MKQQPESQQHTSGSAFEQLEKLSVTQQHLRAESREAFCQAIKKEPDIGQVYQLHLQTREQVQGLERQVRHLNRNLLLLNGMLTAFVVCTAVVCFWLFTRWLPEYRRGMVAAVANRGTMDSPTHSTGSSSPTGLPIAMELKPISEGDRALYPLIFDLYLRARSLQRGRATASVEDVVTQNDSYVRFLSDAAELAERVAAEENVSYELSLAILKITELAKQSHQHLGPRSAETGLLDQEIRSILNEYTPRDDLLDPTRR